MLIGYARVSTADQQPQLQLDALAAAGCERIFTDHGISGAAVAKLELEKAVSFGRPGEDVLIVWKLDRLGRSIRDLIDVVADLQKRGIGFRSLKEAMIDTTSPSGTLIFHVFSAIAEYERGTNHERTMAGIAAAQRAGTRFGRPASISPAQWEQATHLMKSDPPPTVTELATLLGVSRQAIYRRQDANRAASVLAEAGRGRRHSSIQTLDRAVQRAGRRWW